MFTDPKIQRRLYAELIVNIARRASVFMSRDNMRSIEIDGSPDQMGPYISSHGFDAWSERQYQEAFAAFDNPHKMKGIQLLDMAISRKERVCHVLQRAGVYGDPNVDPSTIDGPEYDLNMLTLLHDEFDMRDLLIGKFLVDVLPLNEALAAWLEVAPPGQRIGRDQGFSLTKDLVPLFSFLQLAGYVKEQDFCAWKWTPEIEPVIAEFGGWKGKIRDEIKVPRLNSSDGNLTIKISWPE